MRSSTFAVLIGLSLSSMPFGAAFAVDAHHPQGGQATGGTTAMPGSSMPDNSMPGNAMPGSGMMSGGMMGSGMMGGGMHGGSGSGGMMGGMMAQMHGGMMELMPTAAMQGDLSLTADQARDLLEARLILHGNDRLRVGTVEAADGAIVAAVETVDGSLVRRLRIDPATGMMQPAD